MYTFQAGSGADYTPQRFTATPSHIILLRPPYPGLPDGRAWPAARWVIDRANLDFIEKWAPVWAGRGTTFLDFFHIEHEATHTRFWVALNRWTIVALAPLSREASTLLEVAHNLTHWAHDENWRILSTDANGPDVPLPGGEGYYIELDDGHVRPPFEEHRCPVYSWHAEWARSVLASPYLYTWARRQREGSRAAIRRLEEYLLLPSIRDRPL